MHLGTVRDMNQIPDVFLGDDSDSGIAFRYEDNLYNEVNGKLSSMFIDDNLMLMK